MLMLENVCSEMYAIVTFVRLSYQDKLLGAITYCHLSPNGIR